MSYNKEAGCQAPMVFPVPQQCAGERLDVCLTRLLPQLSRAGAVRRIQAGAVLVDGKRCKAGARMDSGVLISIASEPEPEPGLVAAEDLPLDILFEDSHLLVLNKAAGMVVHPAAGNWSGTLVNALLHHCQTLSKGATESDRPGIVHRLDKETSGCMVVAKNDRVHMELARQFALRETLKIYLALVEGCPEAGRGVLHAPIARHRTDRKKMAVCPAGSGRNAVTEYEVVERFRESSLMQCRLLTGRTHQVRVHMKHLGHPLLGDKVYNPRRAAHYPRHMLHAHRLAFRHPASGNPLEFVAPTPLDFDAALCQQKQLKIPN